MGIWTHGLVEEKYGEVNFMARGIYHATMVNTVSPTYAREIMTPEGGAGLDALLRHRSYDLHGILNGLDYDEWNPATDSRLASPFGPDDLDKRAINKRALQARAGLPQRDNVPLVAMITRLDWQKGLDISGHVIGTLLGGAAGDAQFIALGSGQAEYEHLLAHLAGAYPDKMTAFLDYMPELAPLIYGGSDIFVMPSRFEPCGLGQLIALRYGSVPVVRLTGGLADTIEHDVTGFTFSDYSGGAFWGALEYAVNSYRSDKERWERMQQEGMAVDYSWDRSAVGYQQLYQWALARAGG
jgi:starch synthase